jgi:hypothetical protein
VVNSPRFGQQVLTETPQSTEIATPRFAHAPAQLLSRETEVWSVQCQVVGPRGGRAVEASLVLRERLALVIFNIGLLLLLLFTGSLSRPTLLTTNTVPKSKYMAQRFVCVFTLLFLIIFS